MPRIQEYAKAHFFRQAQPLLLNQMIVDVRYSSEKEREAMGFDENFAIIQLSNDVLLFAMRDPEGNGPGSIFIQNTLADEGTQLPPI